MVFFHHFVHWPFPSNFFQGKMIFGEPKEKILTNFPSTNPPNQPNIPNKFFLFFSIP